LQLPKARAWIAGKRDGTVPSAAEIFLGGVNSFGSIVPEANELVGGARVPK